jgi:glycerol-3-phosphate dehydrogenase
VTEQSYDICVVGGGIIGAAVARDAVGRGLRVYLAERGDFAGGTSSASSKLIHGGLRYLETYEFRMVREGLLERRVLQNIAPHLVHPLKFLVPLSADAPRPAWMVRIGLWLYDFLAGSKRFANSGAVAKSEVPKIPGLKPGRFKSILHYTDGWGDDSRLTLELIRDTAQRGGNVGNYRIVEKLTPVRDGYDVQVLEAAGSHTIHARVVVNAAGPWANQLLDLVDGGIEKPNQLRWVRGSHIVLPMRDNMKIDHALTLQSKDGRVVFVLPWLEKYLIVGTTDIEQPQDAPIDCSADERAYLLAAYNENCAPSRSDNEIVYTWAGVRPLVDDGNRNASKVSRDFTFATHKQGKGGLLTIYGGKLTVHRILAEQALDRLASDFGLEMSGHWTTTAPLPDAAKDKAVMMAAHADLAAEVVPGVTEGDLQFAVDHEYVRTAEDFLFRRTKLGVGMDAASKLKIQGAIAQLMMGKSNAQQAAE